MFRVEMLPAGYGDCLWIEYGDSARPHRILIDGGVAPTYDALCRRIAKAGPGPCEIELLIVSHVDADHIEGVVKLLGNLPPKVVFRDVWFNGWRHLPVPPRSRLGGPQGEKLSALLKSKKLPWNQHRTFGGGAVMVPNSGALPQATLEGGMTLTLLSPTWEELRKLRPVWERECRKSGLIPGSKADALAALMRDRKLRPRRLGRERLDIDLLSRSPFQPDKAVANGSSIAVLAEYDGKSCLFAADAFPTVLATTLRRLLAERGRKRLQLDAFKVSHHGSQFNTSPELLTLMRCSRFLFSTNGAIFKHPDSETVARVIAAKNPSTRLFFNYRTEQTESWEALQRKYGYKVQLPKKGDAGGEVDL